MDEKAPLGHIYVYICCAGAFNPNDELGGRAEAKGAKEKEKKREREREREREGGGGVGSGRKVADLGELLLSPWGPSFANMSLSIVAVTLRLVGISVLPRRVRRA